MAKAVLLNKALARVMMESIRATFEPVITNNDIMQQLVTENDIMQQLVTYNDIMQQSDSAENLR